MHPKKFRLDQILKVRLSAIIYHVYFHMLDIW